MRSTNEDANTPLEEAEQRGSGRCGAYSNYKQQQWQKQRTDACQGLTGVCFDYEGWFGSEFVSFWENPNDEKQSDTCGGDGIDKEEVGADPVSVQGDEQVVDRGRKDFSAIQMWLDFQFTEGQ